MVGARSNRASLPMVLTAKAYIFSDISKETRLTRKRPGDDRQEGAPVERGALYEKGRRPRPAWQTDQT